MQIMRDAVIIRRGPDADRQGGVANATIIERL